MEAEVAPVAAKAMNPIRGISWKTQMKKNRHQNITFNILYIHYQQYACRM